jgi:L,D-peptidoglycan transpeptidase YkuD (ErfK/YbiS/YcfS/YnhG family)
MPMAKFRVWKILLLTTLLIVTTVLLWGTVNLFTENPPQEKIEHGRKLIARAIDAEATVYSPNELAKAQKYWKEAMLEWKTSNEKTQILRNFGKSSSLADKAIANAEVAVKKAKKTKAELEEKSAKEIALLKQELAYIEFACNKFPLESSIRKEVTPISIKLQEAEMAYSRNDFPKSMEKIEAINTKVHTISKKINQLLVNYFENFDGWVKLDKEMKELSKTQNTICLVVDKFSRKCIVYKAGKKHKEIEVELGVNWLGDKIQSGDRATPEGKYKVVGKKSGRKTAYHKSLEIDYPNPDDSKRFEQEKAKGNIPKRAKIGDSIAIHGGGGRGIDWTEGCVALENTDMDILFSLCPIGTQVAIVGSLVPLDEIFEKFSIK